MSTTPLTKAFDQMADQIYYSDIESAVIGTDEYGCRHTWHKKQDVVVVHYGREIDSVHYLDGRTLEDWVTTVRDLRGWEEPGPHGDRLIDADLRMREGGA